jgi:hypothetical protein
MLIERLGARQGSVAKGGQVFLESVVGNASSLFEAQHAFPEFEVDVPIGDKVKQMVLVNDFLWDELDRELHLFVTFHEGSVVKVFDIEHHKFGGRSGDGAVEETFGCGQACALGGGQAGEVEFVATHRDADTVRFGLGWSIGRNEASIGDLSAGRNGLLFNEDDGVGTSGHPGANALGEAA